MSAADRRRASLGAAFGPGSQAKPEAATASSPSVSIPSANAKPTWWRAPVERKPHGCLHCENNGAITDTFQLEREIAVGFGFAACLRDGRIVLEEPQLSFDDDGVPVDGDDPVYPTGADAETLAAADPDHDWQIVIHGPLSGRTYQRHGPGHWSLIEQNEGFA